MKQKFARQVRVRLSVCLSLVIVFSHFSSVLPGLMGEDSRAGYGWPVLNLLTSLNSHPSDELGLIFEQSI